MAMNNSVSDMEGDDVSIMLQLSSSGSESDTEVLFRGFRRKTCSPPRRPSQQQQRSVEKRRDRHVNLSDDAETPKQKRLSAPPRQTLEIRDEPESTSPMTPSMTPRGKSPVQVYQQRLHLMRIEKKLDTCLKQQEVILKKLEQRDFVQANVIRKKACVSNDVRSAIRDGFVDGMRADLRWTFGETGQPLRYDSALNKEMTDHITQFVIGMFPDTAMGAILGATQTYFVSLKQKEIRKKAGKEASHRNRQVKYERRKRKLNKRRSAVSSKTSWDADRKEKVAKAMLVELMSSESEHESDGEEAPHFVTRRLPWRSEEFETILAELDAKVVSLTSSKGKRQKAKRVKATVSSDRLKPNLASDLDWVFKDR